MTSLSHDVVSFYCYCQIYCQIRGSEGIGGDKNINEVSKLLIPKLRPPGSNPSLSANNSHNMHLLAVGHTLPVTALAAASPK